MGRRRDTWSLQADTMFELTDTRVQAPWCGWWGVFFTPACLPAMVPLFAILHAACEMT